jgi:hypothetical protein
MADQPEELAEAKLRAEIQKLRLEAAALHRSPWLAPAFVLAVGGFALSLVGNVIQYRNNERAASLAADQMDLARLKWEQEKQKLELDIQQIRERTAYTNEMRERDTAELADVDHAIEVSDEAIRNWQLELLTEKDNLAHAIADGRTFIANAKQHVVENLQNVITNEQAERARALQRKHELEEALHKQ